MCFGGIFFFNPSTKSTILKNGLSVVTLFAAWSPVRLVPKQGHVAFVWDVVIGDRRRCDFRWRLFKTVDATTVLFLAQKRLARCIPLRCIPSLPGRSPEPVTLGVIRLATNLALRAAADKGDHVDGTNAFSYHFSNSTHKHTVFPQFRTNYSPTEHRHAWLN